ncbi:protein-glutamine gamma-glutamyltransferase [Gammaproteobacteria bacterium]
MPPFLIGLSLAWWGVCIDTPWLGVVLGTALEVLRIAKLRLAFENSDYNATSDLAGLLSLGVLIYFMVIDFRTGMLRSMSWLPVSVLPLALVQIASAEGHLKMRHFFYSLRKSTQPLADKPIDFVYPYFILLLLSASTATTQLAWFLPGVLGLSVFALFSIRPKHQSLPTWILLMMLALGTAGGLAFSLPRIQMIFGDLFVEWWSSRRVDPFRTQTRIGDLGKVQLSGEIVWRVSAPPTAPRLLMDAAYTVFDGTTWRARVETFKVVPTARGDRENFLLVEDSKGSTEELRIDGYSERQSTLVPLPMGATSLRILQGGIARMSPLRVVKLFDTAPLLRLRVQYTPGQNALLPPNKAELSVLPRFNALFSHIREEIHPDGDVIYAVRKFFSEKFNYSLFLEGASTGTRGLEDFLTRSRKGHCEYFATATALLLRSFGIPTRYATGYSLQEFSSSHDQYIVRASHAHAWTQVYVNQHWEDLDTTPSRWAEGEFLQEAGAFRAFLDWVSWQWYQFNLWRSKDEQDTGTWLIVGGVFLFGWLYWRVFRRPRAQMSKTAVSTRHSNVPYFRAEEALAKVGYLRHDHETPRRWLVRLNSEGCPYLGPEFLSLVQAHEEYSYHPNADKVRLWAKMGSLFEQWQTIYLPTKSLVKHRRIQL